MVLAMVNTVLRVSMVISVSEILGEWGAMNMVN